MSLFFVSRNSVTYANPFTSNSATAPKCELYAVHDEGLANSQFFTIDLDSQAVSALGPEYVNADIEGIDFHPTSMSCMLAAG
jgi:hypothetical protein